MKKYIYYPVMVGLMLLGFNSCSDNEDTAPTHIDENYFAPKADDNSEVAQLRRDFFNKNGCYLLFNDTLNSTLVGTDSYGNPLYKTELVDIDYNISGSDDGYEYTYDYLDEQDCRKAAEFIQAKIMNRLGDLKPYSILLVNKISQWTVNGNGEHVLTKLTSYSNPHPLYNLGVRCYAFSMEEGKAFDDPHFFDDIFIDIVLTKIKNKGDAFLADFTGLVENYDDLTYYWKDDLGYDFGVNDDLARSLGFLKDYGYYSFGSADNDLKNYVNAICTTSETDFEEAYKDYPLCISRFKVLRDKILSLGVKLD